MILRIFITHKKIFTKNQIQSYINRASIQKFIGMESIDIYFTCYLNNAIKQCIIYETNI